MRATAIMFTHGAPTFALQQVTRRTNALTKLVISNPGRVCGLPAHAFCRWRVRRSHRMGQFWLRRSWQQAAQGLSQGDPLGAHHGHLDEVVKAAQVVADEGRVSIERLTGAIASGAAIVKALAAKMPAEAKALSVKASRKVWVVTEVRDGFA